MGVLADLPRVVVMERGGEALVGGGKEGVFVAFGEAVWAEGAVGAGIAEAVSFVAGVGVAGEVGGVVVTRGGALEGVDGKGCGAEGGGTDAGAGEELRVGGEGGQQAKHDGYSWWKRRRFAGVDRGIERLRASGGTTRCGGGKPQSIQKGE